LRHELKGHAGNVTALAFSADGRTLATGAADTTILLWDLTGAPQPAARLTAQDLDTLWSDLAGANAKDAYPAMLRPIAAPDAAVPFLKKHVEIPGGAAVDDAAIAQLITKLNDDAFVVREQASRELGQAGKSAEKALRETLKAPPGPEVRRRVEQLLD